MYKLLKFRFRGVDLLLLNQYGFRLIESIDMQVIPKPTYKQWFESSEEIYCNLTVLCKDGTTQELKDCTFNYRFITEYNKDLVEIISKLGYLVDSYFWVDKILSVNYFYKQG